MDVDVENVPDKIYVLIRQIFLRLLKEKKAFEAIADAYVYAIELCPAANPTRTGFTKYKSRTT